MPDRRRERPVPRRRSPYYRATLVAGGVFVGLAIVFPLWLDHVRRHMSQDEPLEAGTSQTGLPGPAVGQAPSKTWVRAGVNDACRAYVYARCNALNIPARDCASVAEKGAAVPRSADMQACRAMVESDLAALARVQPGGAVAEPEAAVAAAAHSPDASEAKDASEAISPAVTAQEGSAPVVTPVPEGPPPAERAERLQRLTELVRDVQRSRSARDFVLSPAGEQARLSEIRRIVEEDGSQELRALYESLRRVESPPSTAPGGLPTVGHSSPNAPLTTPEMEVAARMADAARKAAGLPPTPPPPAYDPSRSLAPSEVPAATSAQPVPVSP